MIEREKTKDQRRSVCSTQVMGMKLEDLGDKTDTHTHARTHTDTHPSKLDYIVREKNGYS